MASFIFRCSHRTLNECLDKKLFGASQSFEPFINQVKQGDTLFLYNLSTSTLIGVFEAISSGGKNLDPEAWSNSGVGEFPFQVRVKQLGVLKELHRENVEDIIEFKLFRGKKFPSYKITGEQSDLLKILFKTAPRLEDSQERFNRVYPHTKHSNDGHLFQSESEKKIDNWLFEKRIFHIAEPNLPGYDDLRADFAIVLEGTIELLYIEFWGLNTEEYIYKKTQKTEVYKQKNLLLIELEPKDITKLDEVLMNKLKPFLSKLAKTKF